MGLEIVEMSVEIIFPVARRRHPKSILPATESGLEGLTYLFSLCCGRNR